LKETENRNLFITPDLLWGRALKIMFINFAKKGASAWTNNENPRRKNKEYGNYPHDAQRK
jgi:hypothetical protein